MMAELGIEELIRNMIAFAFAWDRCGLEVEALEIVPWQFMVVLVTLVLCTSLKVKLEGACPDSQVV